MAHARGKVYAGSEDYFLYAFDLDTLRIVTKHQGRKVPTVGGMLLFGYERERRFPDAWIQAGRFDGLDKVLSPTMRWPKRGPVRVAFGAPIELGGDDFPALSRQVEEAVKRL